MPYIIRPIRIRKIVVGLCAGVLLAGAAPSLAAAACPARTLSHPFAAEGDNASYALIQNGAFEAGIANWEASGSEVVADSSVKSRRALVIGSMSEAVSPVFCVSSEYPTFRFRLRTVAGGGKLRVRLSWTEAGHESQAEVANLAAGSEWGASPVLQLASYLPLSGATDSLETVRLSFTTTHPGLKVAITDVYIDPYTR